MSPTRTLNVVTLSIILLLAGCFGLGDSAEASDEHEHTPPGAAIRHTLKPKIAPLESVNHNGIPRK